MYPGALHSHPADSGTQEGIPHRMASRRTYQSARKRLRTPTGKRHAACNHTASGQNGSKCPYQALEYTPGSIRSIHCQHDQGSQFLFDAFSSQSASHILHLSARLCPIHREKVIQTAKQKLEQGKNIILIATRVIEAGIDISFPTVYRACAGIDSIAQAAGRCNRHGEREGKGLVFVYESTDFPLPDILDDLRASASTTREILAQEPEAALLSPEISNRFFRIYYNNRKNQTNLWDSKNIRKWLY